MADKVNLYLDQGAKYTHIFLYRDKATGLPIDLANYTIEAQIRPFPQSSDVLYDADNAAKSGIEVLNPSDGEIILTIPGAASAAWRHDECSYDIRATDPAGDKDRVVEGRIFISKQTTR